MHNKQNNKESKTYVQGLRPFGNTLPRGIKGILKKNGYNYSEIINKWNAASLKFKNQFKSQITLPELAIKFSCYENSVCSTISGMMSKKEIDINTNAVKNNFSIGRNLKKIKNIYSEFFS